KVLIAGHLPPAAGGITSLLLTIFSSALAEQYELVPFNIGRPAKPNVTNNSGYKVLWNAGFKRAMVALGYTLWHMAAFPFVVLWHRPAFVHIHTAPFLVFWETAYYALMARALRRRCGLQFHFSFRHFYEASGPWARAAVVWILRRVDVFIVICREDVPCVAETTHDGVRCVYLPNFIDVATFRQAVDRARTSEKKTPEVTVLFVGGSEAMRKGLGNLLRAVRLLTPLKLRFVLVAVPKEVVERELPAECRGQCEVYSWASGAAKASLFARADIFVLPSHGEGMPIGILEAMACSLPIVATRVGGIPDMVIEGEEGYLIDPDDDRGLARVIAELARDPGLRERMGRKGLEKVRRLYDAPVGVGQLRRFYEEVTTGSRSAPLTATQEEGARDSRQKRVVAP
ncbi:MAG: glycosyltransferase family 4 protein, partial [Thermodesulfobacteriota bacterium]